MHGAFSVCLQSALAQPADSPARQLAETLLSQQQTALIEQGLDLDSQYQLSHADQAQFAAETANNAVSDQSIGELARLVEENSLTEKSGLEYNANVSLPPNDSQLKHIFRDDEGHLSDSPENRALLVALANDSTKFMGTDQYGNAWNAEILSDGTQNWVRHRNGIINNGGRNTAPLPWNSKTGFNHNPTKEEN